MICTHYFTVLSLKVCIAKNILPAKQLKVTFSDYWNVINEAIPTLMNEKIRTIKMCVS